MARRKRFKRLVHYVCDLCDDPTKLGATKLNKVLWYADAVAFRRLGETISGDSSYIKRQYGPVPKNILKTLRALKDDGVLHVRMREFFGRAKREFQVLKPADPSVFSPAEQNIICDDHTATSISDLSHDLIWEAAEIGEDIPINAVLAAQAAPLTNQDEKWANEIIKKRGGRRSAVAA